MSKAKIFLASLVWLFILTAGVMVYRFWIVPKTEAKQAQAEQSKVDATTGNSVYKAQLHLGLDGFSGYAVLRSDQFSQQLRTLGIKVDLHDDEADYGKRLEKLASGELQLAAFPIDALLKASAAANSLPATIVMIIDETRGADAIVAYKNKYPNLESLSQPNTKLVLVADSPSETLARVVIDNFDIQNLSARSFDMVSSEKDLVARYRQAIPSGNEVFVTWEPVVSELLSNDQMHVLLDTSKQSGYIVDALVVNRDYLIKNEETVRQVMEAYFRALYEFRETSKLLELVRSDAKQVGTKLSDEAAKRLVDGIMWKNTQENFAHFGLRSANVAYIEDIIDRIKRVLLQTGGIASDPTSGATNRLFYEQSLRELQSSGFHPGFSEETVRDDVVLKALSDDQWAKLTPVATMAVPPLIFARGTPVLTERSQQLLDEMIVTLRSWPQYYVLIRGNASSVGDSEANRKLAQQRAETALEYLLSKGVPRERLRVAEGEISGATSVTFVVGQPPF